MKFAEYVVWNLLCNTVNLEKNYNSFRDIEFFLGGYFLARPVYIILGVSFPGYNVQ